MSEAKNHLFDAYIMGKQGTQLKDFNKWREELVPVRLKSESISIEWLEDHCKENLKYAIEKADKNCRVEFSDKNSYPAIVLVNDLLSAAKKIAKEKAVK